MALLGLEWMERVVVRAWLAAGLVAVVAFFWAGKSPWLRWYVLLILSYAAANLGLESIARLRKQPLEIRLAFVAAVAAAAIGAALAAMLVRQLEGSVLSSISNLRFDFGLSFVFSALILISSILEREAHFRAMHERQLVELKLNALQAQIEPHFIYNTLANVQQLVRSSPSEAGRMLESLVCYFKAVIPEVRSGRATVGQECRRAEAYLSIMRIRLGGRLDYTIHIPDDLHGIAVPPLSLMTLVENAVKHGVDANPSGGLVRILGSRDKGRLRLRVIDNGAGFGDETGGGTGLTNLRERISTLYGDRATLELSHVEPSGVEATLELPIE